MTKFAAALLTMLAIAGVIWVAVVYTRSVTRPALALSPPVAANPQAKAADDAMRRLRVLDQTLTEIDGLRFAQTTIAVAPLAASPKVSVAAAPGTTQKVAAASPVISLLYLSPSMQRVVIDGTILGVGDTLPGGGRVVDIGPDEVVLSRGNGVETLKVPKARVVGSVASPAPPKAAR